MSNITVKPFGSLPDGRKAALYTLTNSKAQPFLFVHTAGMYNR